MGNNESTINNQKERLGQEERKETKIVQPKSKKIKTEINLRKGEEEASDVVEIESKENHEEKNLKKKKSQKEKYQLAIEKMIDFLQEAIILLNDNSNLYIEGGQKIIFILNDLNEYLKYFENANFILNRKDLDPNQEEELNTKLNDAKLKFSDEIDKILSK
eukprot:TRINITY_DN1421_c0_g1_i2.p1 TRINITY_DN1421_c0_g1~~TRINITY_DN1421_c0_g1_i2.p1  ORF type:complete len:161 (-),score=59.38 TRINITY_DN1421_c0_g1_i2:104-586(-)